MIALALAVGVFGWGIFEILVMRFDTGTMFPPYSSYRNDPLGTKALFDSLDRLPGVEVSRYIDPLEHLSDGPEAQTVLLIGVNTHDPDSAPISLVEELDTLLENGGRVVLAFAPTVADFFQDEIDRSGVPGFRPKDESEEEEDDRAAALARQTVSIKEHWGIELQHEPLRFDGDGGIITSNAFLKSDDDLPATIEWHNGLQFTVDDETWRTVYDCRDQVVVAERELGRGTLVFIGDSYYLTNEGLAVNRQSELLSWLIGGNSYIKFDEQHLGMQRNPGAAQLMRRYGLESLIAGFIGLALLFAWRAASTLAPRYSDALPANAGDLEFGRDTHAGFANLVQRSTPRGEVVKVCFDQWRHSVLPGLGRPDAKEIVAALTKTIEANRKAAPVDAYRAVLNQLHERNVHTAYDRKS